LCEKAAQSGAFLGIRKYEPRHRPRLRCCTFAICQVTRAQTLAAPGVSGRYATHGGFHEDSAGQGDVCKRGAQRPQKESVNGRIAVQQILDWLQELDLEEYAHSFVENGIDTSVLRDLTDQDLKKLGVLLGHRRKILRAIAENAEQSKNAAPFAESESKAPTHTFNPPKSYTQDPLSAASNDSSGSARRRAEASYCAVLPHRQLDGLGGADRRGSNALAVKQVLRVSRSASCIDTDVRSINLAVMGSWHLLR
jgi:hypothetical protein